MLSSAGRPLLTRGDAVPHDGDVVVAVRSGLLVPEAQSVEELVLDGAASQRAGSPPRRNSLEEEEEEEENKQKKQKKKEKKHKNKQKKQKNKQKQKKMKKKEKQKKKRKKEKKKQKRKKTMNITLSTFTSGGRAAGVQDLLDDVYLDVALQGAAQLPDRAADASLLHFPPLQHLVHHLREAGAVVVVLDGLDFHFGQKQAPRTALPRGPDVVPQQVQVLLAHRAVLWVRHKKHL
ncbi:hypothetical protein EYF80_027260 [Liparis tanakae]|uniref:Uncharacterized protein n=1 Tax=Liparis tanakae TaxID=230148 RepID=A0A4Z2H9I3_9TELE|nr:hypothetical protein EYF80_027260 [Liparis tanakae]